MKTITRYFLFVCLSLLFIAKTHARSIQLSVISIDSPTVNLCITGNHNVYVKIVNLGTSTITSAIIEWSVNGATQTSYSWKGSLGSYDTGFVNLGAFNFPASIQRDTIVSYISKANGINQFKALGADSIISRRGLIGAFTIDPSGSGSANYTSFRVAANALNFSGVCGAVVFNAVDGTYKESVTLNAISGTSAINTVTFQSKSLDSSKVTIDTSWGNSSSGGSTLTLNGASHIIFRELTISNGSTSFADAVVKVMKGSNSNLFTNCRIIAKSAAGSVYGFEVGGDSNSIISNNIIISGRYYGINFFGKGIIISKNIMIISNNVGVYSSGGSFLIITFNKITSDWSGLYIQGYSPGTTSIIANNFIRVLGPDANAYAIELNNAGNVNFYYNSIVASSSYASMFTRGNINVNNNIILNTGSGQVFDYRSLTKLDYNAYYAKSGKLTTNYAKLSDWQATGNDSHSISINPTFANLSKGDFHITSKTSALARAGTPVSIKTDIDGQLRDSRFPDIGADEFSIDSNDVGIDKIISPTDGSCGDSPAVVKLKITNYGLNAQDSSFSINVGIKGSATKSASIPFKGVLGSGRDTTISVGFTPVWDTRKGGLYTIKAYTSLSTDAFHNNDTAKASVVVYNIPDAGFIHSTLIYGRKVSFYPHDSLLTSYHWDFGDTQADSVMKPTHNYTGYGLYSVTLTVTNAASCKSSKTDSVYVLMINSNNSIANKNELNIYPNPFSAFTNIAYTLLATENVKLEVFDVAGRSIATLADQKQEAGSYHLRFNPDEYNIASASLYILKITLGGKVITRELVPLK
jgi:hypothetical protein